MNRYLYFSLAISILSCIVGFGFDLQVSPVFRVVFLIAIDVFVILGLAKLIIKKRKKFKSKQSSKQSNSKSQPQQAAA